jgi:vancomycin aglycone glucosyltransferase
VRVVLSTYGSRGDVEPMAGLGVRLRALGADVRVCAPPDFGALLDRVGLTHVPAGVSVRALVTGSVTGSAPLPPEDLPTRAARVLAAQHDAVLAAGGDAVVATGLFPAAAGARTAADRLGARYAHVSFQPTTLPSPHHPPYPLPGRPLPAGVTDNDVLWKHDAETVDVLFGRSFQAHRAGHGLPPVPDVRAHVLTDRPWLAADPTLAPWPGGPPVEQTGAWLLPDDRPLPAPLEAFLAAGPPPVYVGLGSMPVPDTAAVSRAVVEAARSVGRRLVLHSGWADLGRVDDLPDVLVVGEVNQQALFGRVAAVVHHGGAGTTTTAARAGAPQVVVPQVVDQPYFAARVAALGVGVAHAGPTPTAGSLTAALTAALAPAVRARAAALAGRVRTDGVDRAAALLTEGSRG